MTCPDNCTQEDVVAAPLRQGDALMREICIAIGRHLHTGYLPIVAEPLPRELKDLVAHPAALEKHANGGSSDPMSRHQ
jgi:hypothetical protein